MKNKIVTCITLMVVTVFFLTGCAGKDEMSFATDDISGISVSEPEETVRVQSQDVQTESAGAYRTVYVDVCGAVKYPGVYSLTEDARVFEAIDAAGGLTEDASIESVNQAERISDGQKLYIMNQAEWLEEKEKSAAVSGTDKDYGDGRININTASESELCTLPGIGATRAAAIIAYREKCGGFTAVEEIQKVSGIKSGTYEKICDLIKVQ